jgi:disintegrin and metalloproteinase domain-containing protein 10
MNAHNHNHADPLTNSEDHHLHCASEQLHRRTKRWTSVKEVQEPRLPLDLETPYNTRININDDYQSDQASPNTNVNRNILINSYNPNSDNNFRNIMTKTNHNILTNVFNGSNHPNRINNNFTATNQMNVNSRPNHKTHVEIITKNGPTKRPSNIISNNYNPDLIYANNNPPNKYYPNNQFPHMYHPQHHVNLNNFDMMNLKPATSGSPADRKSTCMLYLQADHTFFQKLGSDEASIESITRHVQRANMIYKNTGEILSAF